MGRYRCLRKPYGIATYVTFALLRNRASITVHILFATGLMKTLTNRKKLVKDYMMINPGLFDARQHISRT